MSFYCQRCGTALPPSARFCSNCGTVVTTAPPPPGRPLVRPIAGRVIAGVCIGVAQANGWDVNAGTHSYGRGVSVYERAGGRSLPGGLDWNP